MPMKRQRGNVSNRVILVQGIFSAIFSTIRPHLVTMKTTKNQNMAGTKFQASKVENVRFLETVVLFPRFRGHLYTSSRPVGFAGKLPENVRWGLGSWYRQCCSSCILQRPRPLCSGPFHCGLSRSLLWSHKVRDATGARVAVGEARRCTGLGTVQGGPLDVYRCSWPTIPHPQTRLLLPG